MRQLMLALIAGTVLGCIMGCIVVTVMFAPPMVAAVLPKSPTPTATATRLATITLAPTRTATPPVSNTPVPPPPSRTSVPATGAPATPVAVASPAPTARPTLPTRTPRPIATHWMVERPVALNSTKSTPDLSYLYGTTEKGDLDVHHGEEFVNPTGTTLYAVADGTVVTAGNDSKRICGDDHKTLCGAYIDTTQGGYYGNLVVIQLARAYRGQRVFALYGHMNRITVNEGDQVSKGDVIGEVGMSGIALGPHIHFEIRFGVNDFGHTRNPILWMTPLEGRGAIAGSYRDNKGAFIRGALVDVYRADGTFLIETETYGHDQYPDVNSDEDIGENFAVPDLAAGDYIVRINGQQFAQRVTVSNGGLAFVDFGGS